MNNPYFRFFIILAIPLLIGFAIGYVVKPSGAQAAAVNQSFEREFPETAVVQERKVSGDQIANSRQNAITRAVAKVSPAVVGINVIAVQQIRYRDPFSQFFDDPFFRQFFGDRTYKQEVKGLGSGFIISPDGYIVTNDHVAGNATDITITMSGGRQLKAKIVGTDQATDICLLKVSAADLPYVTLGNSDDVMIGEWAIALGNPFGLFEINDKPTVTVGVVSSTGMKLGQMDNRFYRDMIETDAAINGGNSGGPLVNSDGDVIGMNTLIYTGGQSNTYIGYGFAIPINKIKKIVTDLKKKGKVTHDITAGFDVQPVDNRIARYLGLKQAQGVIVSDIAAGGPAEQAGLKIGDVILEVNGEKVDSDNDILSVMVDLSPGDFLKFKVYRERKVIDISLKLARASKEEL
jgi:serine protease Do